MLFIVPTPVGNLGDITLRALETLNKCDFIACEDTRTSGVLLSHYEIKTPTLSYHKFNEAKRSIELITKLKEGKNIAVISDAGTPGISDPSSYLIREAIKNNIEIDVLPGATATIPALVISGMNTESFSFCGFLPDKNKDKQGVLEYWSKAEETLVFYVSLHDLYKDLELFREYLGDRNIAIVREISKLHQSVYRNRISYFLENRDVVKAKGEFVVVIEGAEKEVINEEKILSLAEQMLADGKSVSWISKELSKELKLKKNYVYRLLLSLEK